MQLLRSQIMVFLWDLTKTPFSEPWETFKKKGLELYNKIKAYKSSELYIINKFKAWMCRGADKRTHGEKPTVLVSISEYLSNTLQFAEHFHINMSHHLHNNPVKYRLSLFHKWGQSLVCPTARSHVAKLSVCQLRPRSSPPALTFSAMPHCHSWLKQPRVQSDCFSQELSYLAPLCSMYPDGVPFISLTGGLLYQLPWKLLTATFHPFNPSAFIKSGVPWFWGQRTGHTHGASTS